MGHKAHGPNPKSNIHDRLVHNPPHHDPVRGYMGWKAPCPDPVLEEMGSRTPPHYPDPVPEDLGSRTAPPIVCLVSAGSFSFTPGGDVGERGSGEGR